MKSLKVGIIGSGISGLSCAHQLIQAGHEVVIFDKSRGVGGRMSNRSYDVWSADHGAQYFTVKDSFFQQEVTKWIEAGVASSWSGKIVSLTNGEIINSDASKNRYVGVPKMSSPAKYLAQNLNLELSQTILEISNKNEHWEFISKESGLLPFQFDFVIIAIPSIQAKAIIDSHSRILATVCQDVKMLPCWTLLAYLNKPLEVNFDGAFVNNHLFSWIARDNSKPERAPSETWVAQANSIWSEANLDASKEEVGAILTRAFYELTGTQCPTHQIHLWRYAKLETEGHINFKVDNEMNLALCGDWLKTSTIEGAWLSGHLLAKEIIQRYS